tara:strand:+ start:1561 stop:1902 length:342 start_codon:yes stop_codon:yes gene_type:complete
MTSTRDRNSTYNYNSFKKQNNSVMNYNTNYESTHNKSCISALGSIQVSGPDVLSKNFADTESFLRGTYFNNLEEMKKSFTSDIFERDVLSFYKKPTVLMPYPIITTTKKSRFI